MGRVSNYAYLLEETISEKVFDTYGFSMPLATLHKFNGWTYQFLGAPDNGLQDIYLSLSTKVVGGKLLFAYHDFSADESDPADALGSEIDILYAKKFGKVIRQALNMALIQQVMTEQEKSILIKTGCG